MAINIQINLDQLHLIERALDIILEHHKADFTPPELEEIDMLSCMAEQTALDSHEDPPSQVHGWCL